MSIKKRIMPVALSAAMVASLPAVAYASDEKLELVVSPTSTVDLLFLYENKYIMVDDSGDELLINITEEDIADFAENGELSYSVIANLTEMFDCGDGEYVSAYLDEGFGNGYATLFKYTDDSVISYYCVYYDGSELSIVGESESYCGISTNGYIANKVENSDSTTINITAPDGTVKSLDYEGEWAFFAPFTNHIESIRFISVDSSKKKKSDEYGTYHEYEMTLHIIDENADVHDVAVEWNGNNYGLYNQDTGNNFVFFTIADDLSAPPHHFIYLTEEDKIVELSSFNADPHKDIWIDNYDSNVYNNLLIATFTPSTDEGEDAEEITALIDISQGGKQVSNDYSAIYTNNGEIYLAQKADGTWGYLNSKGEELAFFDDAGDFMGDYAPVAKDGKVYLIDRDMNIVSNTLEVNGAAYIWTMNENCYNVSIGDECYFMTFKPSDNTATDEPVADEPVVDEPVADEPATDTPVADTDAAVDTGKDNPDTGAEGIAAIAAIGITAVGAALLSKKKK